MDRCWTVGLLWTACAALLGCTQPVGGSDDDDSAGSPGSGEVIVETLGGDFQCRPEGDGSFPGVLYNHGGLGDQVGGDLEGTCRAFAEAGYVAYSKKRRETVSLAGHLDDVGAGAEALVGALSVDVGRLAIVGFSRGGLLTLQAALVWPELWSAVVLMAPAPANNSLTETLSDVSALAAPVLLQVSENDLFQSDHVQHVADIEAALSAAEKPFESILYPPFEQDGHEMFWEVRDPYWSDLVAFLDEQL